MLNSVVKISMVSAKYFEYYTIILRGGRFLRRAAITTTDGFYRVGNVPKSVSARASPRTPLGELTSLARPLAGSEGQRQNHPASALRISLPTSQNTSQNKS